MLNVCVIEYMLNSTSKILKKIIYKATNLKDY